MSAELPVIGIMVNDSQLRLRLYAMLERHFRLRECTDPTLHQDANLFLLDEAALPTSHMAGGDPAFPLAGCAACFADGAGWR